MDGLKVLLIGGLPQHLSETLWWGGLQIILQGSLSPGDCEKCLLGQLSPKHGFRMAGAWEHAF